MGDLDKDAILLLVLREAAARNLIPRGLDTHHTAVVHAADLLARALDCAPAGPQLALPSVDSKTQVLPLLPPRVQRPSPYVQPQYRAGIVARTRHMDGYPCNT